VGCFSLQFNKLITSGEGGVVITDDEEIWKRAVMYHDVIGALQNGFPVEELLCGINFRMPELLAAVGLVVRAAVVVACAAIDHDGGVPHGQSGNVH
jgi:dTDP-4-amino-4,6-dideoxygalactose transaminase